MLTDQEGYIFIKFVQILDAVKPTCHEQWMIRMEDGIESGNLVLGSQLEQQGITYISSVRTKNASKKTCHEQWMRSWLVGWLVGWISWHVNLCKLFNAKSVFTQIISSISNNPV